MLHREMKKPLSTLDIAKLAGITRMHAYRLAPQIPGAVRARVGAAWRFPDSPELRSWITERKARQIPAIGEHVAKMNDLHRSFVDSVKQLRNSLVQQANEIRGVGHWLALLQNRTQKAEFQTMFMRPDRENFSLPFTFEKAKAQIRFALMHPHPFTSRSLTQGDIIEIHRLMEMI